MRLSIMTLAMAACLSGCATQRPHGNFAGATAAYEDQMAEDAVQQLVALHPPAKTHLKLEQTPTDSYGAALVDKLRKAGYALAFKPQPPRGNAGARVGADWRQVPGIPLNYLLDRMGTGRYLLQVRMGEESISRVYAAADNRLSAAGYWAREVVDGNQ